MQVAVNHKGTFLAAADDSGEIKVSSNLFCDIAVQISIWATLVYVSMPIHYQRRA